MFFVKRVWFLSDANSHLMQDVLDVVCVFFSIDSNLLFSFSHLIRQPHHFELIVVYGDVIAEVIQHNQSENEKRTHRNMSEASSLLSPPPGRGDSNVLAVTTYTGLQLEPPTRDLVSRIYLFQIFSSEKEHNYAIDSQLHFNNRAQHAPKLFHVPFGSGECC